MNWKTWTEKRWFWPAVCLLSLAAGWWYLSIITCAPLGGDDEIINLQNYYFVQHHTFGRDIGHTAALGQVRRLPGNFLRR